MPKENFPYPVEKKQQKDLLESLKKFPELKDIRLSRAWNLDRDSRDFLNVINNESEGFEDEGSQSKRVEAIKRMVGSDDEVKIFSAVKFLEALSLGNNLTDNEMQEFFEYLEKITESENYSSEIRGCISAALKRLRKEEGVVNIYDLNLSGEENENTKKWLLGSQKAVFATPDVEQVAKKIISIKSIIEEVKEEVPDVCGVIILGSTVKGYAASGSDIEVVVLTDSSSGFQKFKEELEKRKIKNDSSFLLTQKSSFKKENLPVGGNFPVNAMDAFRGLYVGDRKALEDYQKNVLEEADEESWKKMRLVSARRSGSMHKAMTRWKIPGSEVLKMEAAAAITQTPPPLEEARRSVL